MLLGVSKLSSGSHVFFQGLYELAASPRAANREQMQTIRLSKSNSVLHKPLLTCDHGVHRSTSAYLSCTPDSTLQQVLQALSSVIEFKCQMDPNVSSSTSTFRRCQNHKKNHEYLCHVQGNIIRMLSHIASFSLNMSNFCALYNGAGLGQRSKNTLQHNAVSPSGESSLTLGKTSFKVYGTMSFEPA